VKRADMVLCPYEVGDEPLAPTAAPMPSGDEKPRTEIATGKAFGCFIFAVSGAWLELDPGALMVDMRIFLQTAVRQPDGADSVLGGLMR